MPAEESQESLGLAVRWLHTRLVIPVLVAVVPVLGLFVWSAADEEQAALSQAKTALQAEVLLLAAEQGNQVESVTQLLSSIASGPSVRAAPHPLCFDFLENLRAQHSLVKSLVVADLDGRVSCQAPAQKQNLSPQEQALFQQVLSSHAWAVGKFGQASDGEPTLAFARPVYTSAGTFSGVAFAELSLRHVANALGMERLPQKSAARVLDRDGVVLAASPEHAGQVGQLEKDPALLNAAKAQKPGIQEGKDLLGAEKIHAFAPVVRSLGGMFVAVSVPREAITAMPRRALLLYLLVLLAVCGLGIAAAWLMASRLILKPTRSMLQQVSDVGEVLDRTEAALELSEGRFRELAENFEDVFYNFDSRARRFLYVSPAYAALWGRSCESLYQDPASYMEAIHPDDRQAVKVFGAGATRSAPEDFEYRLLYPDGSVRWVRDRSYAVRNAAGQLERVVGTVSDVTARKQADAELARTHRALQLLSACNRALTRLDEEEALLREICRLAVEVGGYRMAWVGYAQHDDHRTILPMAHAGHEDGYLSLIKLSWRSDVPPGQGPAGQAIRTGQPAQCEDIAADTKNFIWHEAAMARGYRSSVVLPLLNGDQAFGIMAFNSPEVQHVGEEEVRLLRELADNLAFGIESIRARQGRNRVESAIFKVAAGVSAHGGSEFFQHMVRNMVDALGADAGFILRALPGAPVRVSAIAGLIDNELAPPLTYALAGTPCEVTAEQSSAWVFGDLPRLYASLPEAIAALMPQAYVGQRLDDSAGQMAGLIFVVFREAPKQTPLFMSALKIFASRASAELERMQADERLREQASLLDKAQDAIFVRSLDHRILYINRGAEQLYAWPAAQALGASALDLKPDPETFARAMASVLETGEWVGELTQVARDGTPLVVEGRWTLVRDADGRPKSVLATNTDIRKRKLAELEIQRLDASLEERVQERTAQLKLVNQELESFSYSVSHDLRSPLSAVDGFSSLLQQNLETDEAISPASRHYVKRIRAGVVQMGELIDALLALAKLSREPLRYEHVSLSDMASSLLETYQERTPARAVTLTIQPGLMADGDPRLLKQLLENLLGNAWKFSSEKALAHIEFGQTPEVDPAEGPVYFVRDNGAGFNMDYAQRLFNPFQRLHTITEFEGTGIGLATVHRIVARHGGRVWAVSKPEEGATFYFTLGKNPGLA